MYLGAGSHDNLVGLRWVQDVRGGGGDEVGGARGDQAASSWFPVEHHWCHVTDLPCVSRFPHLVFMLLLVLLLRRALCQHDGCMYLVLEYCPRGTLDVLLHHSARLAWDPARLLAIARSIARGMLHLHMHRILHRDVKPANIFISHGQQMKIGDLGMARFVAGAPHHLHRLTPNTFGTMQARP